MMKAVTRLILCAYLSFAPLATADDESDSWRIVNYWSEWCAPCRIEIPIFNALSLELQSSGIKVVGVNFDEDPREVTLDIADELGVEFPTLTQPEVDELALRPPDVMPTTFIISPDNEVAAKLIGMQSRESLLGELERLGLTVNLQ